MRVGWLAFGILLVASLSGCFGGKDKDAKDDHEDHGDDGILPILTLKVRVGNDTFDYTTAVVHDHDGTMANSSASGGNATGNATGAPQGNSTGNQTGNATGNASANATVPDHAEVPGGLAPLNVSFEFAVKNATGPFLWTLTYGDEAAAPSGNATGNATAGNDTSTNQTSTSSNTTAGNGTGNATDGTGAANQTMSGASGNTTNGTLTHTYLEAGNYTVTFTVKLANATLVQLRAHVLVAAGSEGGNDTAELPPPPETIVLTGTISGIAGEPGSAMRTFDLAVPVQTMTVALTYSDPGGQGLIDLDWHVTGPGGETEDGTNFGPEDPVTFEAPSVGTWNVEIVPFTAAQTSYTITVTFT